ncbi:MAG: glutaredoxin family protein [Gammaproteobacteria bacterium]|nr:glutaredoxin family protein [Gammaproteobacteria bacterium]
MSLAISVLSARAWCVDIMECEDESDGTRTFQAHCPPGTKQVNEKSYSTTPRSEVQARAKLAVTLYAVPECVLCDQLREFLAARNVQFTEKNPNNDVAIQNEMKEKAGELRVPTLIVGEKSVVGYNRAAATAALIDGGYLTEEADQSASTEEAAAAEEAAEAEAPAATEAPAGGASPP